MNYLDKVEVVSGFFKGHIGIVMKEELDDREGKEKDVYYHVEIVSPQLECRDYAIHVFKADELKKVSEQCFG